jgi:hypothetical protein
VSSLRGVLNSSDTLGRGGRGLPSLSTEPAAAALGRLEKSVVCPAAGRRLGNDDELDGCWDLPGDSKALRDPGVLTHQFSFCCQNCRGVVVVVLGIFYLRLPIWALPRLTAVMKGEFSSTGPFPLVHINSMGASFVRRSIEPVSLDVEPEQRNGWGDDGEERMWGGWIVYAGFACFAPPRNFWLLLSTHACSAFWPHSLRLQIWLLLGTVRKYC